MNLRNKFVNSLAVAALALGVTGSAAFAAPADTDSADTTLNVTCPVTSTVDVNVYGQFEVDTSTVAPFYDADLAGGFEIVLDLTCNWSTDFAVKATIGTFNHVGPVGPLQASAFGGSHLLLDNGHVVSYTGPDIYLLAEAPDVEGSVFEFFQTTDPDVIENGVDWLIIFPFATASPGVTTANWDGHLDALPGNLANGTYVAPLTVELTVN